MIDRSSWRVRACALRYLISLSRYSFDYKTLKAKLNKVAGIIPLQFVWTWRNAVIFCIPGKFKLCRIGFGLSSEPDENPKFGNVCVFYSWFFGLQWLENQLDINPNIAKLGIFVRFCYLSVVFTVAGRSPTMGYGNGIHTLSKIDLDNPAKHWEKVHNSLKDYQVCLYLLILLLHGSFQNCINSRTGADSLTLICTAMATLSFPFTCRSSINSLQQVKDAFMTPVLKKM